MFPNGMTLFSLARRMFRSKVSPRSHNLALKRLKMSYHFGVVLKDLLLRFMLHAHVRLVYTVRSHRLRQDTPLLAEKRGLGEHTMSII